MQYRLFFSFAIWCPEFPVADDVRLTLAAPGGYYTHPDTGETCGQVGTDFRFSCGGRRGPPLYGIQGIRCEENETWTVYPGEGGDTSEPHCQRGEVLDFFFLCPSVSSLKQEKICPTLSHVIILE